ncbi:unnamed protein product [Adineta steineri]|uniref:Uncharacterized protein n=2 Tax=Adineta steineri TaxID=433720 RepID=A0A818XD17_9BILA|nr:unnamed protein product [Adineta steineri]CAF3738743.1 unnamed protein product [Adineta steineri]
MYIYIYVHSCTRISRLLSLRIIIIRFSQPALSNHPGRATLVSGPKRQSISQAVSMNNRLITSSTTTSSTPSFSNIEHIRRYSLSRTHSEQPSNNVSEASTPSSSSRRTSVSETTEGLRRESIKSNTNIIAPKSLREWHEQPVNLSEQPPLSEKVNVQILSPNSDRATPRFFVDNDLASLIVPNGESKFEENSTIENEQEKIH